MEREIKFFLLHSSSASLFVPPTFRIPPHRGRLRDLCRAPVRAMDCINIAFLATSDAPCTELIIARVDGRFIALFNL